ncbi:antibiotic biosynthesis monooxygenase [Octadecabacter sp.]|nr:antibiotic biosynthesis monooxygenase [Octadecabacter sp.]
MIAVIFEVIPVEGEMDSYLDHAAMLKPILESQPGFISVERFRSLSDPDKLLSLSFFENEAAVANWRTQSSHRNTQTAGRNGIFIDYRLRVAEIQRDYGLHDRGEAPRDSRAAHS